MSLEGKERPQYSIVPIASLNEAEQMLAVMERGWKHAYINDEIGVSTGAIDKHFSSVRSNSRFTQMSWLKERQDRGDIILGAKQGDRLLGFVIARKNLPRASGAEVRNQISALYVDPDKQVRRKKIGTELMRAITQQLDGTHDTEVAVVAHNSAAIAFYHSLGFEDTGKFPEEDAEIDIGGKKLPQVLMLRKARE